MTRTRPTGFRGYTVLVYEDGTIETGYCTPYSKVWQPERVCATEAEAQERAVWLNGWPDGSAEHVYTEAGDEFTVLRYALYGRWDVVESAPDADTAARRVAELNA